MSNIEGIGGSYHNVRVPGKTDMSAKESFEIAKSVADILTDDKKPKKARMEEACSKLIDLWLENSAYKSFGESKAARMLRTIKASLQEKLPEDVWNEFNDTYLEPSIRVMSEIRGGYVIADKFDFEAQVASADKLQDLGVNFFISKTNTVNVSFYPGVKVKYGNKEFAPNEHGQVVLKFDPNVKEVKIVEKEKGFEMRFINNDGSEDVLEITKPERQEPDTEPKSTPKPSGYTPGTRYAVVNKDEVKYQKRR